MDPGQPVATTPGMLGPISLDPRPRILIVDDEDILLRAMVRVLSDDYTVTAASNGVAALARLRAGDL